MQLATASRRSFDTPERDFLLAGHSYDAPQNENRGRWNAGSALRGECLHQRGSLILKSALPACISRGGVLKTSLLFVQRKEARQNIGVQQRTMATLVRWYRALSTRSW
jgi:hypothetical protein